MIIPKNLEELKPLKQWVNYIRIWNPTKHGGAGGYDKPPINPFTLWDGKTTDHAILKDLPKVDNYHVGDTVLTSSSSLSFPQGFMVGVVERISPTTKEDSFMTLIVKLSCKITHLSNVHIIKNNMKDELKQLESTDATSLKEEGGMKR